MFSAGERKFLVICRVTIFSLFALILAGGIVRSSGSGMGCPDWPKCFDRYIPPVSESQLPAGYREKYVQKRALKNERFAKTLDVLGYGELANRIRDDKSITEPEDFNASKTWTEYINRLIGALTGFFMIGCLVYSVSFIKKRKRIFYLSLLNLVLVGFQGWLGSIVVSTNLLAWIVTVHMLVAIAIVGICIYTYYEAAASGHKYVAAGKGLAKLQAVTVFALLLTIFQVTTGTEVREQIDAIAHSMNELNRNEWVSRVGMNFTFHRDMAAIVALVNGLLIILTMRKFAARTLQFRYASFILVALVLQVIAGISLAEHSLPGLAQAAHVTLAVLLFASELYLLLLLNKHPVQQTTSTA